MQNKWLYRLPWSHDSGHR